MIDVFKWHKFFLLTSPIIYILILPIKSLIGLLKMLLGEKKHTCWHADQGLMKDYSHTEGSQLKLIQSKSNI